VRFSLRTKTIAGVAIIELTLLSILIFTAISFLTAIIDETLTKRAQTTASLFAATTKDALLSYDLASLNAHSEELMTNSDIAYVRVIGSDDRIFAFGGDRELLITPFNEDRELSDVNDGVFDTYAHIKSEGIEYGRIEVGVSIQPTLEKIARVRAWSGSLAIIELLLVATFSAALGTYLTRQLKALTEGSKRVRKALKTRNFDSIKVPVNGKDELGQLAVSFNGLVESLQQELQTNQSQKDQLVALNNQLEEKIAQRTLNLKLKNEELTQINIEMKETQQQLLQAEKMASVGQLAAGVAHEINNPIGFVSSNLSTLKDYVSLYSLLKHEASNVVSAGEDQKDDAIYRLNTFLESKDFDFINEDIGELVDESSEGLNRVSEIVSGLKLFSRVDSDDRQLFDINACLKTTLNMVKNELKYDCDIETDFGKLPKTLINVGQLNQVFTNLLINAGHAIKASQNFGKLRLATKSDASHIYIEIEDNGTGMSEETLHKIFNPFFTTKPEGSGTGLGLSISFGIIEDHGGSLSAKSKLGEGSTFQITLPITSK
jgi:signal transduction histidine kinase